jgi:hypothetical protein
MATITYDVWVINGAGQRVRESRTETIPDSDVNAGTLRTRALQALAVNSTFLAIGSPSNAQILTQVQRLTRECSGLIRLLLGQLDEVTDT